MKRICLIAAAATLFAAPALAEDTITIGFTASQTGPLNVDSLGQQRGYEFWRDEVNAAGGIKVAGKSYHVNFVSYDDQSVGGRVQQLYTRLVVQDKADFLFSPYSSGLTAPATVISEQYGKVMIVSGGAEEKPFMLGNKHLFMVITSAGHYLSGAVEALKAKNPHAKIAMVYSDDPFSKTVLAAAAQQAKDAGLDIVMNESYAPSTTDFGPIVNKIISSNADAFLGGGHYSDGATLARQMYDQKANMKWVSILVAPADDKFGELGAPALGVTVPSQWEIQVNYKPQFGPTTAEFAKAYPGQIQRQARLSFGLGLYQRRHPAARHRASRLDRSGKSHRSAQRNRRHHLLRPYQVRHRSRPPWAADGARDGAGAVAKGRRQAGPASGLAGGGAIRQSDLSDLGQPVIGRGPAVLCRRPRHAQRTTCSASSLRSSTACWLGSSMGCPPWG